MARGMLRRAAKAAAMQLEAQPEVRQEARREAPREAQQEAQRMEHARPTFSVKPPQRVQHPTALRTTHASIVRHAPTMRSVRKTTRAHLAARRTPTLRSVYRTTRARRIPPRARTQRRIRSQCRTHNAVRVHPLHEPAISLLRSSMRPGSLAHEAAQVGHTAVAARTAKSNTFAE
jgi:hypothetical protein